MKDVLFIAYLFPPLGGGGVQRSVKFVRYLPQFGWQPVVLTARAVAGPQDPSLTAEVPAQTPIVRVGGARLPRFLPWRVRHWITRWLLVVDEQIGWLPFAAHRAVRLVRERPIRAICSTAGPYTDHLVGLRVCRAAGLPWIADFRDEWLDNRNANYATRLHRTLIARLERQVVWTADRVLTASEPMRRQLIDRYSDLPADHLAVLPNGFDPADFDKVTPAPRDARFTLVYTGSLYGVQTGRPFLTALRQALDQQLVSPGEIAVRFVGNTGDEAKRLVGELRLEGVVQQLGYMAHAQAIAHQLAADALLLIVGASTDSEVVFTGKLFEYLVTRKPILALVPPGAAATLVAEAGAGRIVPPDDVPAITAALAEWFTDWRAGRLRVSPDPAVVARYDRRLQAGQLAGILDELVARPAGPSGLHRGNP